MPSEIYSLNPIALYEQMASEDSFAYCPFAYTYSNYSRIGFAAKPIRFSNPVTLGRDKSMRTVLGGTGIAISSECKDTALALQYSRFVASESCQRTIYGQSGGQPARKSAWNDPVLNQITDSFFLRTDDSIERAYVRPRYRGYVVLQERAGQVIAEYCKRHGNTRGALEQIDVLYRLTLGREKQHV